MPKYLCVEGVPGKGLPTDPEALGRYVGWKRLPFEYGEGPAEMCDHYTPDRQVKLYSSHLLKCIRKGSLKQYGGTQNAKDYDAARAAFKDEEAPAPAAKPFAKKKDAS